MKFADNSINSFAGFCRRILSCSFTVRLTRNFPCRVRLCVLQFAQQTGSRIRQPLNRIQPVPKSTSTKWIKGKLHRRFWLHFFFKNSFAWYFVHCVAPQTDLAVLIQLSCVLIKNIEEYPLRVYLLLINCSYFWYDQQLNQPNIINGVAVGCVTDLRVAYPERHQSNLSCSYHSGQAQLYPRVVNPFR